MCPHITGWEGAFWGCSASLEGGDVCTLGGWFLGASSVFGPWARCTRVHTCTLAVCSHAGVRAPLAHAAAFWGAGEVRTEPPGLCQGTDDAPRMVWGCTGYVLPATVVVPRVCGFTQWVCLCATAHGEPQIPLLWPKIAISCRSPGNSVSNSFPLRSCHDSVSPSAEVTAGHVLSLPPELHLVPPGTLEKAS